MKTIIRIPRESKCLVVEDSAARLDWFREKLPGCTVGTTAKTALDILSEVQTYDIVFLDHDAVPFFMEPTDSDFLDKTFWKVAQHLHRMGYPGHVVIHSGNPVGAKRMAALLGKTAKVSVIPFGSFDIEVFNEQSS